MLIQLKSMCLTALLISYMDYYHAESNHWGLANTIPFPGNEVGCSCGLIHCRERLAGLLRYYFRDAA